MAPKTITENVSDLIDKVGTSGDIVSDLIERGTAAEEVKYEVFAKRTAIRDSLRALAQAGALSRDQKKWVEETYPVRQRGGGDAEEAAPAAQGA